MKTGLILSLRGCIVCSLGQQLQYLMQIFHYSHSKIQYVTDRNTSTLLHTNVWTHTYLEGYGWHTHMHTLGEQNQSDASPLPCSFCFARLIWKTFNYWNAINAALGGNRQDTHTHTHTIGRKQQAIYQQRLTNDSDAYGINTLRLWLKGILFFWMWSCQNYGPKWGFRRSLSWEVDLESETWERGKLIEWGKMLLFIDIDCCGITNVIIIRLLSTANFVFL